MNELGEIWLTKQMLLSAGLAVKQVLRASIPLVAWIVGFLHDDLMF